MIDHVFVYGTLKREERNHDWIRPHVKRKMPGSVQGLLMYHRTGQKEYPYLIADPRNLEKVMRELGIQAQSVRGEIFELKDVDFLERLDMFEGINEALLARGLGEEGINHYARVPVMVDTKHGKKEAWTYIARPAQPHTDGLIRERANRVVIPSSSWREFNHHQFSRSLHFEKPKTRSTGLETEIEFMVNGMKMSSRRYRGKYRINDDEDKRHDFPEESGMLSQLLYHHLKEDMGVSPHLLNRFFERSPLMNRRFLLPYGMAYIDGEHIEDNETHRGIRHVSGDPLERQRYRYEERRSKSGMHLPSEERFIEIAGFPIIQTANVSVELAIEEWIRRYHLTSAYEHVDAVRVSNTNYTDLESRVHSTQYNTTVKPFVELYSRQESVDRITAPTRSAHPQKSDQAPKLARDIAQIYMRSFAPLASYFLMGRPDFIEMRIRGADRLEFRTSATTDLERFACGVAIHQAAVNTVEDIVKHALQEKVAEQVGAFGTRAQQRRALMSAMYELSADGEFVHDEGLFSELPLVYPSTRLTGSSHHHGYRSSKWSDGSLFDPTARMKVSYQGQDKMFMMHDILRTLYHHRRFQENLELVTTYPLRKLIDEHMHIDAALEAIDAGPVINSANMERDLRRFANTNSQDYSQHPYSYGGFVTNFLLGDDGTRQWHDRSHNLIMTEDAPSNDLRARIESGSIPLRLILQKGYGNDSVPVDSFSAQVTPRNYERLLGAMRKADSLSPIASQQMWKLYYALK